MAILVIIAVGLPVQHWMAQSKAQSEADDVANLIGQISHYITPQSKFSFTSNEEQIRGIVLYDYALLAMAPAVIPDNGFGNDTIIAISSHQKTQANMYNDYNVIAKAYGNEFSLQLLVKK